jgi:electron-transferring-flavoprotein dehydrogenase
VKGVVVGVVGIGKDGQHKDSYEPGMELHGKYVFIAEGVRGSLAKQLEAKFDLRAGKRAAEVRHRHQGALAGAGRQAQAGPGAAHHRLAAGQQHRRRQLHVPLRGQLRDHRLRRAPQLQEPLAVAVRRVPAVQASPVGEPYLEGGRRIAYGARAITEGGFQSVPKLTFPGGALIGCSAGFVNVPRIKGSHNAMKTGMLAAEAPSRRSGRPRGRRTDRNTTAYREELGL